MTDQITLPRAVVEQALEALQHLAGVNCDHSRGICVCEYRDAANNLSAPQQQAEPVQFDPAEAMNLADSYAFAQSELDGSHFVNRPYYVESRNDARAKLASYLGTKENGNG